MTNYDRKTATSALHALRSRCPQLGDAAPFHAHAERARAAIAACLLGAPILGPGDCCICGNECTQTRVACAACGHCVSYNFTSWRKVALLITGTAGEAVHQDWGVRSALAVACYLHGLPLPTGVLHAR